MYYQGSFPAREYLETVPEDFGRFLQRCEELGDMGRIRLPKHGHWLKGPRYGVLFQFNMEDTRSWGFRTADYFLVLNAAPKDPKNQERDYEVALEMREDYLNKSHHD
jgi:hypothetical protein